MSERIITVILIIVLVLSIALLFGCSGNNVPKQISEPVSEPIEGGTVTDKTDPNAPKEIKSKDISDFYATFFLEGEWSPGREYMQYTFEVKPDADGKLTASETGIGINAPATPDFMASLQDVIDKYSLVQNNGVYNVTAGLPPEYQLCELTVSYASGEKLTFTTNNNPDAEWIKDTYLLFADHFAANGDDSMLPPDETKPVSRIIIRFKDDGKYIEYRGINVQEEDAIDGERYLLGKDISDLETNETIESKYILFPEDYFDRITEILSRHDIRTFDNYSVLYGRGRNVVEPENEWTAALQLHFEFEDGSRLNTDTDEPEDVELLRPLLDDLFAYYDTLF